MKQTFTRKHVPVKFLVLILTIFSFSFTQSLFAHVVKSYTSSCNTGPVYSIGVKVEDVNSGSNYAWQYKNTSGSWICIVNGNNTINGYVYSVSGATSTATTSPQPIVFNNPNGGLQGLVIRCVISDGNNVNPCNMPANNTYNSGSNSVNFTIDVNNSPCQSLTATNPDINVTYVNLQVPGNVSTNDDVPSGTTYGTPANTSKPSGSTATIVMNSNGTYTFVADKPGVYVYNVPVCVPGHSSPCPPSLLTITVLALNTTNPPVANTDFGTTKINTPVTLNSLANDRAGYPGGVLNPAGVTVVTAPLHGTTSVNTTTGAITYTPANGFVGMDTLTYRVCDKSNSSLCATAKQIITIKAANAANTTEAADDYATTAINTSVSGNVKTNDTDPEGNTQTVAAQTTTATGKGTLALNSDGSYVFTPATGFTGAVSFVYSTCDNGTPQACAHATLYITVAAVPDLTPRINLNPNNIIGQSSMEITVQVNELNNITTNGSVITLYVDKQSLFSNFTFNSTQTTNLAGQPVQNNLFTIDATSNLDFYVITTNAAFANSLKRVAFSVTVKPGQTKGSTPVNVFLVNGSGGETNFTNNSNFTVLTFSF